MSLDFGLSGLRGLGYVSRPSPGAMFDESSVSWRFASRWPVLVGGPAAVLLQVAHPSVAAGVAEHSTYDTDPLGRLERTLYSMLAISFGSPIRRDEVLAELRTMHRAVAGDRPDGGRYRALDPGLQLWVWATLIHVALEVDRRYVGQLDSDEREQYYREQTQLARVFRVPDPLIPADLEAFEAYIADTIATLEVTDQARMIARTVVRPKVLPFVPRRAAIPLELVTIDLLGDRLRREFDLPRLGDLDRLFLGTSRWLTRRVLPMLPDPLLANPLNKRAIA